MVQIPDRRFGGWCIWSTSRSTPASVRRSAQLGQCRGRGRSRGRRCRSSTAEDVAEDVDPVVPGTGGRPALSGVVSGSWAQPRSSRCPAPYATCGGCARHGACASITGRTLFCHHIWSIGLPMIECLRSYWVRQTSPGKLKRCTGWHQPPRLCCERSTSVNQRVSRR